MERRKNEHERQAFFTLFNDVSHAKDDVARAAALNKVRKIRGDAVHVSIVMSLAHAYAIGQREKYLQANTREAKRDMQLASAVAAYIGLDNNKVRNPYRNNKTTDGQTFVLDSVKSIYETANDTNKTLLDEHYDALYGKNCTELIAQVSAPTAERHLIPIDAKKVRAAAIGSAAITAGLIGIVAPANAAHADISLSPSPYSADSIQTIPASFSAEVFNIVPTASDDELTLEPIAPPDSNDGGEIDLDPIAPPDNGEDSGEMDLNPIAPPDNSEPTAPPTEQPPAPVEPTPPTAEEPTPTPPPETEAPKPTEPPATEKPAPKPEAPNDKNETENQKEKEAKAYKVYTDYVRANVASLEGNSKWHPMDADKLIILIDKYYEKYKDKNDGVIDREYIAAVLWQESKYDPRASSGVADGIGQFTKGTVDFVGNHIDFNDAWDPEQSVEATFWYYNYIYNKFDGYSDTYNWSASKDTVAHKLEMSLAGYNAGPFSKIFRKGKMPGYAETNGYRRIIMGDYNDMKKEQAKILGSADNNDKKDTPNDDKEKEQKTIITGYSYNAKGVQKLHYWNQGFDNGSAPYAGGSFKDYGCAPSTLATIVSTLTDVNISNVQVGQILNKHGAMVNGSGTNREAFKNPNFAAWDELGIEMQAIDLTDAAFKKVIDNGGMVVMRQKGGVFASSNGRSYAHFMAVTGYNNHKNAYDNVDHKFYIADSNSNTGARYTKNEEGFSFSTIKGDSSRARTGNLTNAYAVYTKSGQDAPKSDVSQKSTPKEAPKTTPKKVPKTQKEEVKTETVNRREPKAEAPKEMELDPIINNVTPEVINLDPIVPLSVNEPKTPEAPKVDEAPKETQAPTETVPTEPVTPETIAPVNESDTPQALVEDETVVLRNKFNPHHVVTNIPMLTKQQMHQAKMNKISR